MTIEQNWQQLSAQAEDKDLADLLKVNDLSRLTFRHPLELIRTRMRLGVIVLFLMLFPFSAILIIYPEWPLRLGVGSIVAYLVWGILSYWKLYDAVSDTLIAPHSLLQELKQHLRRLSIQRRMSSRLGSVIWPICVVAGEMFGHMLGSREPLGVYVQKTSTLWIWGIGILTLVPLSYFLMKTTTRNMYSLETAALEKNIKELESE